jgi:hypothetical protein
MTSEPSPNNTKKSDLKVLKWRLSLAQLLLKDSKGIGSVPYMLLCIWLCLCIRWKMVLV